MKQLVLIIAMATATVSGYTQNFDWKADVETPQNDGFHKILLAPVVAGHLQYNFSDIRIYNHEQKEVPYFLTGEEHRTKIVGFENYTIVTKDYNKRWDWESMFVIKNEAKTDINHIILRFRNFQDRKYARLSGSDDGHQWFSIKDGYLLHGVYSDTASSSLMVLKFPMSNYEYYKIEVDDYRHDDPVNLMEAGYFVKDYEKGSFIANPYPEFQQIDSIEKKETQVYLNFPSPQYIDKMKIDIDYDDNYHREAELFEKIWLNDTTFRYNSIKRFWVSSTRLNEVFFHQQACKELKLVIYNNDDQPLKVNTVDCLQLKQYLVAKLKKDQPYTIKFGNDTLLAPQYDIVYFKDQVPEDAPVITTAKVAQIIQEDEATEEGNVIPLFEDPTVIWIVIGAVALLLGYMSLKMMSEVKKKADN